MILLKFIQCLGLPWRKEKERSGRWFVKSIFLARYKAPKCTPALIMSQLWSTNQVNYENLKPWEPLPTDTSICKLFVIYRAGDEVRLFSLLWVPILILPCASVSVPILAPFGNPSNTDKSQNGKQINSDPNDQEVSESPEEKREGGLASWISRGQNVLNTRSWQLSWKVLAQRTEHFHSEAFPDPSHRQKKTQGIEVSYKKIHHLMTSLPECG